MAVSWDYYNRFKGVMGLYLPNRGEGSTMANQIVTAINKLIYKWYNDGDVFDNNYVLEGWANDLSSYANWLYTNVSASRPILDQIKDCYNDSEYEDLLQELADEFLDSEYLEAWSNRPTVGSIYDADGPYSFDPYRGEDDEDDDWDEWSDEEDPEDEEDW